MCNRVSIQQPLYSIIQWKNTIKNKERRRKGKERKKERKKEMMMDLDRVCIKDQVEKATTESTLEFPRMPSKTDKERAFCWGLISSTLSITARKGGELFRVMEMWFQR